VNSEKFDAEWTIIGAREVQLLPKLINEQALPSIMGHMLAGDWTQWDKERLLWL
jgi:hypothetical protein